MNMRTVNGHYKPKWFVFYWLTLCSFQTFEGVDCQFAIGITKTIGSVIKSLYILSLVDFVFTGIKFLFTLL